MVDVRKTFGIRLRKIRLDLGLTQEELADRVGLHPTYIGQIERGVRNPSLINLEKISKALKAKSSDILPF